MFLAVTYNFYSAAALLAMQSAVLATAIPSVSQSVCLSVKLWYPTQMIKIGSCGLHCDVAKTL